MQAHFVVEEVSNSSTQTPHILTGMQIGSSR